MVPVGEISSKRVSRNELGGGMGGIGVSEVYWMVVYLRHYVRGSLIFTLFSNDLPGVWASTHNCSRLLSHQWYFFHFESHLWRFNHKYLSYLIYPSHPRLSFYSSAHRRDQVLYSIFVSVDTRIPPES
jgi:hypothetical protein